MPSATPSDSLLSQRPSSSLPLWLVSEPALEQWSRELAAPQARWLESCGFKGERHRVALLPAADGAVAGAALGLGRLTDLNELTLWHAAGLADKLAGASFHCATPLPARAATQLALGFVYGQYRFDRYRHQMGHQASHQPGNPSGQQGATPGRGARLTVPDGCDIAYVTRTALALGWGRDLINTPAADLGPRELAEEARKLADQFGAHCTIVEGEDLLAQNYPAIHAVGRASSSAPRLVDCKWGPESAPKVTLVGKGVCFDTGGLDLKTSQSMALMKKDMGGAACVLALARMIMDAKLPVRLRVLIPAVENSVAGNAYRPGDVIATRRGLSVEIGNTDAEGRLVLCDALTEGDAERPDLLIDLATLTGAARVALGPELPALYGSDQSLVDELLACARLESDPMWQMPLWAPYDEDLASKIADLNNVSPAAFAGSIIGALFLKRFVAEHTRWLHIDLFAWNPKDRPGRPAGAEAQCVRALYALIADRYPPSRPSSSSP